MRLFFLTIPKPPRQHPIYKKIIHAALQGVCSTSRRLISKDLGEKLPDPSIIYARLDSFTIDGSQ